MPEVACPSDEMLWPLAVGEQTSDEVQQHAESCPQCRQRVARLRAEIEALAEVASGDRVSAESRQATEPCDAPPDLKLDVPAQLGPYRLVSQLGVGGQAVVFRAIHVHLGRDVVIKLSRRALDDAAAQQRLLEEGRHLAALEHPNLCRVYDLGMDAGRPYLVQQYLRGVNLKQYAAARSLTARQKAQLIAEVARAAAAAHDVGLVHRDIKPANIVVDASGRPYLIDFGLARVADAWSQQSDSGLAGTPAFMAPEQAAGRDDQIGPATDVFGLGATLYWLLTGSPPWEGENVSEVRERAAGGQLDLEKLRRCGAPRGLIRICRKSLQADPADRFAAAGQLADALQRWLERPRKVLAGLAGCLLVCLLVLVIWLATQTQPQPSPPSPDPEIAFRIVRPLDGQRPPISAELADLVPLRNGDRLQIDGRLPRGMEVAVLVRSADGQVHVLENYDVVERSDSIELSLPRAGSKVELQGVAGTEVLLVCAGRSAAAHVEQAAEILRQHSWPSLPADAAVYFDRQRVWIPNRRGFVELDSPEKPAVDRTQQLCDQLRQHFDYFAGVVYQHESPR